MAAGLALALALALVAGACRSGPTTAGRPGRTTAANGGALRAGPPASFRATLAPWQLPAPVSRPVVLADGPDLVVLGGLTAGDTSSSGIFQIDPATGRVSQVGQLPQASHDAGGAALGGRLLVLGGGATTVHDAVQAFSAGRPAAVVVGHLPRPRADLSVASAGGVAYVVGGFDGATNDPAVLATRDGSTFRTVARLPHPVRYAAAAALGPYVWVLGGVGPGGTDTSPATTYIQRIDPRTGQATVAGTLPVALSHAAALVVDGTLLVVGGLVGGHASPAMWRLDPATARVAPAGSLPEAVSMPGAAAAGGVGYLVGGESAVALRTVVEVRPG